VMRGPGARAGVRGGERRHNFERCGHQGPWRAEVAGQMLPGIVSAWILPESSTYPGLPYVVFPGNVGDEDALVKVIQKLRAGPDRGTTEWNGDD
jgi:hypothetical protein